MTKGGDTLKKLFQEEEKKHKDALDLLGRIEREGRTLFHSLASLLKEAKTAGFRIIIRKRPAGVTFVVIQRGLEEGMAEGIFPRSLLKENDPKEKGYFLKKLYDISGVEFIVVGFRSDGLTTIEDMGFLLWVLCAQN